MLHAGLFDDCARVRARSSGSCWPSAQRAGSPRSMRTTTSSTSQQAKAFQVEWTPRGWMRPDLDLLGFEQQLYLRQPGYGTSYVTGKYLLEELMRVRSHQLGEDFSMKRYFDEVNGAGMIPVSLIQLAADGKPPAMTRLALLAALAFATTARAGTTLDYTVQHAGRISGAQTTQIGDDGLVHVSFSYRDNGRGPDIAEEIRVAADGTILSYRLKGKSTFGAALDERFSLAHGRANWHSPSERGEAKPAGPVMYLPNDGSPEIRAMIVRASQRRPDGRIAALPGGELQSARIAEMRVGPAGQERNVALYSILGLGMQPAYVWLDDDAGMRLFARISPGTAHVIAKGYEAWSPKLEERQVAAATEFLRDIAAKDARRLPDPVLIRDVRVFDTASATLGPASDVYLYGGRIASIYPAGSPAQGAATVIEGGGRALLPGLFDMHTHEDAWNAALQIAGGVTTSRDMANDNALLADMIARIGRDELIGPHVVPAGFIEGESPYAARGGFVVNNVEEAQKAVDWYAQRGYRQIKLYNSIHPDWVEPIAVYAHARGLRVSGHVPAFSRAERVVREGYDELQHINQLMLNFVSDPDTDSRTLARFILVGERAQALDLDSAAVRDFIALLAERQIVIDATLATFEGMYTQGQGELDPAMAPIADHVPFATQRDPGAAIRWKSAQRS